MIKEKKLLKLKKYNSLRYYLKKEYGNLINDIRLLDNKLYKQINILLKRLDYNSASRKVKVFIRKKENEKNIINKKKIKQKLFDNSNIVIKDFEYLIYKLSSQKEYEINGKFLMSNCIGTNYIYKESNNYELYLLTTIKSFKKIQKGEYSFNDFKDSNNYTLKNKTLNTMYAFNDKKALTATSKGMINFFIDYIILLDIDIIIQSVNKYITKNNGVYSTISPCKMYKKGTMPKLHKYIKYIGHKKYGGIDIDIYYNTKIKDVLGFIIGNLNASYKYILKNKFINDNEIEITYEINDTIGKDIIKI